MCPVGEYRAIAPGMISRTSPPWGPVTAILLCDPSRTTLSNIPLASGSGSGNLLTSIHFRGDANGLASGRAHAIDDPVLGDRASGRGAPPRQRRGASSPLS